MGLFDYTRHRINQILRHLHKENADPLEISEPIRKGMWEIRAEMFLAFVKGKRVLDLGCGYGYDAFLFSKVAEYVVGVDIDGEAISKAYSRYYGVRNLVFIKDDASNFLRKTEQSFDVITLFEFIEHLNVTEQRELLKMIAKHLKPGGRLLLSTPNGKIIPFYRKNPHHKKELNIRELSELLLEEKFRIEEIKGQLSLCWFFVPLPWLWLEKLWILFKVYEKVHKLRDDPENSRTIFIRAVKC